MTNQTDNKQIPSAEQAPMTEEQKGEIRAKMRNLLQDAASLGDEINATTAEFIWEAARSWDFAASEPVPEDFDEARDRYCEPEVEAEDDEAAE